MENKTKTLAALGFTGPVTMNFVNGFLNKDISLRLLTRNTQKVSERFPEAKVFEGSMMNVADVTKILEGVDAAILTTPMGVRNDNSIEIKAANTVIKSAKNVGLKHLIYISALGVDKPQGTSILDAKYEIEKQLRDSGLKYTILRCGSYMQDVFDSRLVLINNGIFLFPVLKERMFTYTSQLDIPRFVVEVLLLRETIINGPINFIEPGTYSVFQVENILSKARGKKVSATGKFPLYQILWLMQPYFYLKRHRLSTIIPLLKHFNRFGYVPSGEKVQELFPDFKMTTLEEHIHSLFIKAGKNDKL